MLPRALLLLIAAVPASATAEESTGPSRTTPPLVVPERPSLGYVPHLAPSLAASIRERGLDAEQRFVAKGVSPETIRARGGRVTASFGPIVAGVLPGRTLVELAPNAVRIDRPRSYRPALDTSRADIGVDRADFADGFETQYRGRGALIGIYDTGIDLAHPDLREVGGPSRVVALWDQTRIGAPPPGQIGGDYCDAMELSIDDCAHTDDIGHGTLVASIAASNAPMYRGVAPEAKLAVATSTTFDRFLDTLAFLSRVAADEDLPLVVNISLAGQEGPHDGTSLEAQAIDAFDHLVVAAAGNEGALPVHAVARLEKGDITSVVLRFPLRRELSQRHAIVDIWGDVGLDVSAQLQVVSLDGEMMSETATIAPGDAGRTEPVFGIRGELIGSVDMDTDDPSAVENGQGHIRLALELDAWEDAPDGDGFAVVRLRGEGRIDLWVDSPVDEPAPIYFDNERVLDLENQTLGDTDHTISDLATAISAVSVSAYVTKTSFTNAEGQERTVSGAIGKIAAFSSWGPTLSESTTGKKPDIAAPGHLVVAAKSSALELDDGSAVSDLYRAAAGTSMAAPHVAGAAALLLGARPETSKTDLKGYLLGGAVTDADADPALDPRWGAGRLDVAGSLEIALGVEEGCSCRTTRDRAGRGTTVAVFLMALFVAFRPTSKRCRPRTTRDT